MSPRVGTIVALVAAALLAVSIAFSWWSGHPILDGKRFERKTAHVSLITGSQCNFADDEETDCKHLSVGGAFGVLKYIELGAIGILVLSLIGSAVGRRRGFAQMVMLFGAVAAVLFVVLIAIGPDLKTGKSESMPLAFPDGGLTLFILGMGLSIFAGVIALMPPREASPVQWSPPSVAGRPASNPNPAPGFNVEDLLAQDTLRPAALGPEPMLGKPQSPGGMLPGPAGPLSPPSNPQPLFQGAPQLRPLYEANGGFVPPPPVQFPARGPTPVPQAAVSALVGGRELGEVPTATAPPPAVPAAPRLPPPSRTKPPTAPPPLPRPPTRPPPVATTKPPPPRAQATQIGTAVPIPLRASDPGDRLVTTDFAKADGHEDTAIATPAPPPAFNETFDGATSESRTFSGEERTETRDSTVDIETAAREKISRTEMQLLGRAETTPAPELVAPSRASATVVTSASPQRRTPIPAKTPPPMNVPLSTAPDSLPPPSTESAAGGPSPACPQCEAPMTWVEEHLRFYCKGCRMYF